ncbi:DNA replication protein [Sporosarcina sp. E16_3]|uniref:DNA replication protein n=1 Tax=Sporosarcina sp. E16_3 TaxID=2789293 RepID=UPI001A9224F1|nr:DNA replication protein [Sporosarcina sp. E16_3]MBO0602753.1 DNA replication protein [Sporosarcina sp. E16_3]
MTKCILDEKRNGGCSACNAHCQHYIALHGLSGTGGRIGSAGLPKDYRNITLANSPVKASQSAIYESLGRYADTFGSDDVKSVYLWSDSPGTGKTSTAAGLINAYIARTYYEALLKDVQPPQLLAYFLDVNAWQELYTGFTRPNIPKDIAEKSSEPYYRQMERAKMAPFAVLDDLGVRDATDGFRGDLHTIINYRVSNGLPTIYTSNLPIEEMATVFDARLYDRIRDQCGVIHFKGVSHRGRR